MKNIPVLISELSDNVYCDDYECTLNEYDREIAEKELHESDNVRRQALDQLREWIRKSIYIKKCRMGMQQFLIYVY